MSEAHQRSLLLGFPLVRGAQNSPLQEPRRLTIVHHKFKIFLPPQHHSPAPSQCKISPLRSLTFSCAMDLTPPHPSPARRLQAVNEGRVIELVRQPTSQRDVGKLRANTSRMPPTSKKNRRLQDLQLAMMHTANLGLVLIRHQQLA